MRTPPIKFYPPPDLVQQLGCIAGRLQMSRSQLMARVLEAFVTRDYDWLRLMHDLSDVKSNK
jgi:hypothetical protein